MADKGRGRRIARMGVVVSDKMDKSVVVRVDRIVLDELYKKHVRRSARFLVHDETNLCRVGDRVEIVESRPLSARKRWRVRRVLRQAAAAAEKSGPVEGA